MAQPKPFITDQDDSNESLLIHDIARLFKKNFDRRVRSLGLTRSQWLAVATLRRHPGISQSQLADKLDVEPITAARTIDRLQKSGWIERRPDEKDRRINRIYLTSRVKDVVARMRTLALQTRNDALSGVEQKDHEMILRILKQIKTNLCDKTKMGK